MPIEPVSITILPWTLTHWLNTNVTPRQFQLKRCFFFFLSIGLMPPKLLSYFVLLLIIWNVINLKPKTPRTSSKLLYNDNGTEVKNIIKRLEKEILMVNFWNLQTLICMPFSCFVWFCSCSSKSFLSGEIIVFCKKMGKGHY